MRKVFYFVGSVFVILAAISFVRIIKIDYSDSSWYSMLTEYFILFSVSVLFAYMMLSPHTILKYLFAAGFVWLYMIYRVACTVTDLFADKEPQRYKSYRSIFHSMIIKYENLFVRKPRPRKYSEVRR